MNRDHQDTFYEELFGELRTAEAMSSGARRAGGLLTLVALVGWIGLHLHAWNYLSPNIQKIILSRVISLQYSADDEAGADASAQPDVEDMDLAAAKKYLAEKREKQRRAEQVHRQDRLQREQELRVHLKVQGVLLGTWGVVLSVNAVLMFCAALAGLMGAGASRKWHWSVVWGTLVCSLCTIGIAYAVVAWAGFPPLKDKEILWQFCAVQCSYAIAVLVALLLTRRTTLEWLAKVS